MVAQAFEAFRRPPVCGLYRIRHQLHRLVQEEEFLMDWIPFDPYRDENPFGPNEPVKKPRSF
jgi:hypothetical protein